MDTSDLAEFKSIMEQGAERYRADQARIAALEAQLAASEARCAELDGAARADEQRLRGAAECAGVGWFGCDTPEVLADTIGALRVDLAAALARAEEAECARLTTERGADLNRRIMQAFKDAEEARLRLLGVLAILVEDGIISSGRARELGAIGVDEQRAYLSQVMPGPAAGDE